MTDLDTGFDQYKKLVEETPPDDLAAALAARPGGVDGTLDEVFDLYQQSFEPANAEGAAGTFQFDITNDDRTRPYFVAVADGACRTGRGAVEDATATIRLSLVDFLHMTLGATSGAVLAMGGRLEVEGDVFASMTFSEWFSPPWDRA